MINTMSAKEFNKVYNDYNKAKYDSKYNNTKYEKARELNHKIYKFYFKEYLERINSGDERAISTSVRVLEILMEESFSFINKENKEKNKK